MSAPEIPSFLVPLLWDVDLAQFDQATHAELVMERVMTKGSWEAMKWLRKTYSSESLAEFLRARGHLLAPRDLAYWSLVCEVSLPIARGGGRPGWADA